MKSLTMAGRLGLTLLAALRNFGAAVVTALIDAGADPGMGGGSAGPATHRFRRSGLTARSESRHKVLG